MGNQGSSTANSSAEAFQGKTAALRKQLREIEERLASFVPEAIPTDIRQRPLRPGGPLDTDWSFVLAKEFEHGGYAGLGRALQQFAKETKDDARTIIKKNYDDIADDGNHVSLMITLATMNEEFLKAVLEGTLFHEIEKDAGFRRMVLGDHGLRKSPGNYIQAFVRRDVKRSSTQSQIRVHGKFKSTAPHYGKSLTPRQLVKLYETARTYLPSDGNTDPQTAFEIDRIFQPGEKGSLSRYQGGLRKYCQGHVQEEKLRDWLDVLKSTWIDRIHTIETQDPNDPALDEPMTVAPFEIGWGVDLQARANAHDNHITSNNLFTFYQALVRHICDRDGTEYHVPRYRTHLIFDPKNAFEEGKLGDMAMTLLAQSEWIRGGLNPQPGGGAGVNKQSVEERKNWIEESQKLLFSDNSLFFENMKKDDEKLKRLEYLQSTFDVTASKAAIEQRMQECLQKCYRIDVLDRIVQVADCEAVLREFNMLTVE